MLITLICIMVQVHIDLFLWHWILHGADCIIRPKQVLLRVNLGVRLRGLKVHIIFKKFV
jgi:hypothetical protein